MIARHRHRGRVLAFLAGCLALVTVQVLAEDGPLILIDFAVHRLALDQRWPDLYPLAKGFELLGQRGLVYLIAAVVGAVVAWRARSWRPVIVLAGSLITLNLIVGTTKMLTGRRKPFTDQIDVFEGGVIFPSGHAANVVLVWGIVCYLLLRYGRWRLSPRSMAAGVAVASLALGAASIYLDTHWVSDLLAGWLVGALVLGVSVLLDHRVAAKRAPPAAQPTQLVTEPFRPAHPRRELTGSHRARPLAPTGAGGSAQRRRPSPADGPEPTREVADG